jgi:chromosome segregation ATPase
LIADEEYISMPTAEHYADGVLVLAELSSTRQISELQEATPWILKLVEQYLSSRLTPSMLQEEAERAEQWRQSLTLQSQELGRRAIETEARREKLLEMEEGLKLERRQLEEREALLQVQLHELEEREAILQVQLRQLEERETTLHMNECQLDDQREYLTELEENLRREKKQLDLLAAELKANVNQ